MVTADTLPHPRQLANRWKCIGFETINSERTKNKKRENALFINMPGSQKQTIIQVSAAFCQLSINRRWAENNNAHFLTSLLLKWVLTHKNRCLFHRQFNLGSLKGIYLLWKDDLMLFFFFSSGDFLCIVNMWPLWKRLSQVSEGLAPANTSFVNVYKADISAVRSDITVCFIINSENLHDPICTSGCVVST